MCITYRIISQVLLFGGTDMAARQVCNEFDGVFEKIVFAVFTNDHESENYRAFSETFGSGN